MALTPKQKTALLVGGTVVAVALILYTAEEAEAKKLGKKLIDEIRPSRPALPPAGEHVTTPVTEGETIIRAEVTAVPCDPLVSQPEGMGCFDIDGEWMAMPMIDNMPPIEPKDSDLPTIGEREIGVSNDYSAAKIGAHWEISTLHPFLEEERWEGRLAVMNHDGSIADFLFNDPASAINSLFGTEHAGGVTMAALYTIATAGVGGAFGTGTAITLSAGTKLGAALEAGISGGAWALGTAKFSAFKLGVVEVMTEQALETYRMWAEDDDLRASAMEAFEKFRYTHRAVHGTHGEVWLKDLPWKDFPAMGTLQYDILLAIGRYQRRTFS